MPDISLGLSGVKPLLSSLGLGQAPDAKPKDMSAQPPPPMAPQPTPPQAGFSLWSADPATQQRIANSLTMPGQPITPPNVPDASPLSGSPTPPPLITPNPNAAATPQYRPLNQSQYKPLAMDTAAATPAPASGGLLPYTPPAAQPAPLLTSAPTPQEAQQTLQRLDMAANRSQYQNPGLVGQGWKGFLRYGVPAALVSAGSGLSNMGRGDPTAGFKMLNEQIAQDRGVPAANAATYDLRNVKPLRDAAAGTQAAAATADTQSQTALRIAQGDKASAQGDDMKPFVLSPAQAAAINHPELAGTTATMRDYSRLVGMAGNNNTSAGNNQRTNDTKTTTETQREASRKAITDAANKTRTLIASMHDSTSRANNADSNATKGGGGVLPGGSFKVPADVTKRAALGSNVLENADAVEKTIAARPDIIGVTGGRYSNVQQMIGSDDPDIQSLGVRMHNIALASNGAHGVRSQQAIQKTEDELFNNFKAGPHAIKGALDATRGSMQTFLDDEQNFQTTGKRTTGAPISGGNPPAEGTSKLNSHGDKVIFKGGKWMAQ